VAGGHDIVVVGTSLGGVTALQALAAGLPADFPGSVFVVIHLNPRASTSIDQLMARAGRLPARLATNMEPILPGQILIAPPDHHLMLGEGYVRVIRGPHENGHRPAVDPLFRTAARVYGPRVVGVVLTGALDCGTAGLAEIKHAGGIAVVQDPDQAECPGMPSNALRGVKVDYVRSLEHLPALLVELARTPAEAVADPPRENGVVDNHLSCPACHGALNRAIIGAVEHYRCRVGHAYSLDGLVAAQGDAVEHAMWALVRSLEESADLSHRAAQRSQRRGDEVGAAAYQERAASAITRARAIRGFLETAPGG
jgi:two-component system, chemotaxis family, protein-glutamate methylesterase/glutaminase